MLMTRRPTTRQAKPKPDPALYADFLAALTRLVEHNETVTVHGYTVSWPTRPGTLPRPAHGYDYRLDVRAPQTLRSPWDGGLRTYIGERSGDARNIKKQAAVMAFDLMGDRALRARLLAEAEPGILSGTVTHEAEAA